MAAEGDGRVGLADEAPFDVIHVCSCVTARLGLSLCLFAASCLALPSPAGRSDTRVWLQTQPGAKVGGSVEREADVAPLIQQLK